MATDNLTTQSIAPATVPASIGIAARTVAYGGAAAQYIAPVGQVAFAGADGSKVAFDLGAASNKHLVAAGSGDATNVKGSPGLLVGISGYNNTAATIYLKFHNVAGVPTPGTGVVKVFALPPGEHTQRSMPLGVYFSTGIAFSIVSGITDADATSVNPSDCVVDIEYQ